jgi:hypothetical protein
METMAATSGSAGSALLPVFVLLVALAIDLWVYVDAKAQSERGTPVVFSVGSLEVKTPTTWFFGCLILWIVFFPLYLTRRNRTG